MAVAKVSRPTRAILDTILGMPTDQQATVVPAFALTHKVKESEFYDFLAEREEEKEGEALCVRVTASVVMPDSVSDILKGDATKRLVVTVKMVDGKVEQTITIQTARGRKAKA